jgi:hypothetical protein
VSKVHPILSHETDGKTIPIDIASSGDNTILTVPDGHRFLISYLHLDAAAAVDVVLKSGTVVLSGLLRFAAAGNKTFSNSGDVVVKGRLTQNDFIINLSGAVSVDGFLTYTLDKSGVADPI